MDEGSANRTPSASHGCRPEAEQGAARPDELDAVLRLVREAGLPTDGLSDAFPDGYAVARRGRDVVAVAGLETYGRVGLLRSVAVRPDFGGAGLGRQLVEERLRAARERHLDAVYLLTTTAADYFRRLGFRDTPRASAPGELAASPEFASVCPASAACLSKNLA